METDAILEDFPSEFLPNGCYRSDNTLTKTARIAFTLRMCPRWCRPPGDSPGAGAGPGRLAGLVGLLGGQGRQGVQGLGRERRRRLRLLAR